MTLDEFEIWMEAYLAYFERFGVLSDIRNSSEDYYAFRESIRVRLNMIMCPEDKAFLLLKYSEYL